MKKLLLCLFVLALPFLLLSCTAAAPLLDTPLIVTTSATAAPSLTPTTPLNAVEAAAPATATAVLPTSTATATVSPTPFYTGARTTSCGQQLPLTLPAASTVAYTFNETAVSLAREAMPPAARPAFDYLVNQPQNVGLVAYRFNDPTNGIYLNESTPLPLASVVKIIHLITYVEAVERGELNPAERVPLEHLAQYYLPGSDLGTHNRALEELEANGRIDSGRTIALQDVAAIMMRYSSNAATDYLHYRLGQARLEQTIVDLGLQNHTAPCPFVGQFLAMSNPVKGMGGASAFSRYVADPTFYAAESALLADAFINDSSFRNQIERWRTPVEIQRSYVSAFGTYGRPIDYAQLMVRIAQNALGSPESSFQARLLIEWPMRFEVNQALFTNLGYKDGSLPGVLTTAYYAYPRDGSAPLVVILFFRNVPQDNYREWRRSLAHDELARWLLYDPAALSRLRLALAQP